MTALTTNTSPRYALARANADTLHEAADALRAGWHTLALMLDTVSLAVRIETAPGSRAALMAAALADDACTMLADHKAPLIVTALTVCSLYLTDHPSMKD